MANHGNRREQLCHLLGSNKNLARELSNEFLKNLIEDMEKRMSQSGSAQDIIHAIRTQYLEVLKSGNLGSGEAAEQFKKEMNEFFNVIVEERPSAVVGRSGNQSTKIDVKAQSVNNMNSTMYRVDAGSASTSPRSLQLDNSRKERSASPRPVQQDNSRIERKQQLKRILESNEHLAMEHGDGTVLDLIRDMKGRLAQHHGRQEDILKDIENQYLDMLYKGPLASGVVANEFKKDMNQFFNIPKQLPLYTTGGHSGNQSTFSSTFSCGVDAGPAYEQLNQNALQEKEMIERLQRENVQYSEQIADLKLKLQPLDQLKKAFSVQIKENTQLKTEIDQLLNEKMAAEKQNEEAMKYIQRKKAEHEGAMKSEKRKFENDLKKMMAERDDLRDRFSKLAGAKLTDQNPDIADLSDPNRAMKLSEKFGTLYDDEWTNAFEALTDKMKIESKSAIQTLLQMLNDAWSFCERMSESQMQSLNNVFLHPLQDVVKIDSRQTVPSSKDRPRINSKNAKELQNLRRDIGVMPQTVNEIKQAFFLEMKSRNKDKKPEMKIIEACSPYLQSCAEVCWLMILPDPPLFIHLDVKSGERMDPNHYSVYSTSGDKINYLVWPALFNCKGGGLLSKGVVEPVRSVKK